MDTKSNPKIDEGNQSPIKHFLMTTSVKGIPKAYKARSAFRRTLWVATCLFGFGVSGYFLYRLFETHGKYESSFQETTRKIDNFTEYLPLITVCNLNPFANVPKDKMCNNAMYGSGSEMNELHDAGLLMDLMTLLWNATGNHSHITSNDLIHTNEMYMNLYRLGKLFEISMLEPLPRRGFETTE